MIGTYGRWEHWQNESVHPKSYPIFLVTNRVIIDEKQIIAIKIQQGANKPYYLAKKGLRLEDVYVRQGTSSVPASDTAIRRMIKETDGDSFESMRSLEQGLTFVDAEKALGVSSSTASRLLRKMVKQGLLLQTGNAKNTKYLLP